MKNGRRRFGWRLRVLAWIVYLTAHEIASAAVFVVATNADAGVGSLRSAIEVANATPGPDQIFFSEAALGTIALTADLPTVTDSLEIAGPGVDSLEISGSNIARPFVIGAGADVTIRDVRITNGRVSGNAGGGLRNEGTATITRVRFSGNNAPSSGSSGGAIANFGTLAIRDSTLIDNHADGGLAGGGAISSTGFLTISGSTLAANTSCVGGAISTFGSTTVINSTLSNNSASCSGGAILGNGGITISSTTVVDNSAPDGGGIFSFNGFTLIHSSLLVNNAPTNCGGGGFISTGNNLATDATCLIPIASAAAINLGPLAENGGPTSTRALLAGSVAIDAAADCNDSTGAALLTDQRGFPRPAVGGGGPPLCDLGSYEFGAAPVAIPTLAGSGLVCLMLSLAAAALVLFRWRADP